MLYVHTYIIIAVFFGKSREGVKQEDCRIEWVLLKKTIRIRQHRQTVKSKYLLRKRKEKRLEYGFDIVK